MYTNPITTKQWELISMLIAFIGIPLTTYQYIATWYLSLCVNTVNIAIYFNRRAYAHCIGLTATWLAKHYGIYQWSQQTAQKNTQTITTTSYHTWQRLLTTACLLWTALYLSVRHINTYTTHTTPNPTWSSFIITLMLIGEWLTANKKLEAYIIWVSYNLLSIIYHYQLSSLFWIKYTIYIPFCIHGYYIWHQKYQHQQAKQTHTAPLTSAPPKRQSPNNRL